MRRWLIGLVIVVLLGAAILPGVFKTPSVNAQGGGTINTDIKTAVLAKGDLKVTVNAVGSVVAKAQSDLSFLQPGTIVEVLVKEGDSVKAGQLLARQDDSTALANVQQADYAVSAAQSALDKLLLPVDAGDVANAEANVKAAQAAYSARMSAVNPNTIHAMQLQYDQAKANAASAQQIANGVGGQYATDDPNFQKAVAQIGQAQFAAEIARLKLEQASEGVSLESATATIAFYQAKLIQVKAGFTKQVNVDLAQAQLAMAKLQRDQAKHLVDYLRITAPYDGVITKVNAKPYQGLNGAAMTITDTAKPYVDVNIDEADIGKIAARQPVDMTFDALPGSTVTGKVQRIAQLADANASVVSYTVRVVPDKSDVPFKIGMTVNASFVTSDVHDVLLIPNGFFRTDHATNQVTANRLNADGTYSQVVIKLGLQGSDYSEVIDGLAPGDTVATTK